MHALPVSLTSLIVREQEVQAIYALLSRPDVRLVTVNSHVRSIYSKLGVTSRSGATRYAIDHELL
jgi:ATP/maltotriose-dependent transcriptional regulator MalT